MKMKLFPATLRDRAKDWFLKLGKEFTSWIEMEEEFLRKYYSIGKTTSVRKAMHEFTQGPSETFHEAWERLRDLTRECPHHGVSNNELTEIFHDRLGLQDRYLLDAFSIWISIRGEIKEQNQNRKIGHEEREFNKISKN